MKRHCLRRRRARRTRISLAFRPRETTWYRRTHFGKTYVGCRFARTPNHWWRVAKTTVAVGPIRVFEIGSATWTDRGNLGAAA